MSANNFSINSLRGLAEKKEKTKTRRLVKILGNAAVVNPFFN
jgi:hypothetical protein